MPRLSATADRLKTAIQIYLYPRLRPSEAMPTIALDDVSGANFSAMRTRIRARVANAARGKLAQDADLGDLMELLDAFEELEEEGEDEFEEEEENSPNLFSNERPGEPEQPGDRRRARDYSPAPDREAPYNGLTSVENRTPIDATDRRRGRDGMTEFERREVEDRRRALDRTVARYRRVMDHLRGRDDGTGQSYEYDPAQDRTRRRARDMELPETLDSRRAHDAAPAGRSFLDRVPSAGRIGNPRWQSPAIATDAAPRRTFADRVPSSRRIGTLG